LGSSKKKDDKQRSAPSLLCLKGQKGTIACRVYDPLSTHLLPQRSSWGRLKYALLSEEKMGNLTAVRGAPGARMLGPGDYFCDLERSDQYTISIDISEEGIPTFQQHPLNDSQDPKTKLLNNPDERLMTKVKAQWFSGFKKEKLKQKILEYPNKKVQLFSESLFPNPGLLEIEGPKQLTLQTFDPRGIDFSSFKARLVRNDTPFQITSERLYVDDEYCAVSYHYEPGYAERQVKGGGLFLEYHQFAQTITPLHSDSKGFVTLAKWNETHEELELIAVQIPYGYTLIIEKNCIHGDATLNGQFMMCMTSDHISMATADTVFLKQSVDKDNLTIALDNPEQKIIQRPSRTMDPLAFYKDNKSQSFALFNQRRQKMNVIFSPFNWSYWEVQQEKAITAGFLISAVACLLSAIPVSGGAAPFTEAGLYSAALMLAGLWLFRVLNDSSDESLSFDQALSM
jgi:hypothetical protein